MLFNVLIECVDVAGPLAAARLEIANDWLVFAPKLEVVGRRTRLAGFLGTETAPDVVKYRRAWDEPGLIRTARVTFRTEEKAAYPNITRTEYGWRFGRRWVARSESFSERACERGHFGFSEQTSPSKDRGGRVRLPDQGLVELKWLALALDFANREVSVLLRKVERGIGAYLSFGLAAIGQAKSECIEFGKVLAV